MGTEGDAEVGCREGTPAEGMSKGELKDERELGQVIPEPRVRQSLACLWEWKEASKAGVGAGLPLASWVTLAMLLDLFEPRKSNPSNGGNTAHPSHSLREIFGRAVGRIVRKEMIFFFKQSIV